MMMVEPMRTEPAPDVLSYTAIVDAVATELLARGAHLTHHGRWSLYAHLVETHRVLERWNQPPDVCLAGLVHSVYSTDVFADRLFSHDERPRLRSLVGEDAERLVHAFCTIDRRVFFAAMADRRPDDGTTLVLAGREGTAGCELTADDIGRLLVLYMANEVEQSARPGGEPGTWIALVSQLGTWARAYAAVPPPVFGRGIVRVSRTDERALLDSYAATVRADVRERTQVVERLTVAAQRVPWIGEPMLLLALNALAGGDAGRAAELATFGRQGLETLGSPWDKRLTLARWLGLADFIVRTSSADRRAVQFATKRTHGVLAAVGLDPVRIEGHLASIGALDAATVRRALPIAPVRSQATEAPAADVPPRFVRYVAGFRENQRRPRMSHYPGLSSQPFHDASRFALARDLEQHAPAIIAELRALDAGLFHQESEKIARSGSWDVFMLNERGRRRDENCALCPVTTAVVERHRTVRTLAGLIYVSKLAPKSRVEAHYGPTNMRLRCHLGIKVPDNCGMSVGGVVERWQEGRCVVFDDSFEHFVWNDSDEERIVLIVDLWHPDLGDREVQLLQGFHRYAAAHGANLAKYWDNNLSARQRVAMME